MRLDGTDPALAGSIHSEASPHSALPCASQSDVPWCARPDHGPAADAVLSVLWPRAVPGRHARARAQDAARSCWTPTASDSATSTRRVIAMCRSTALPKYVPVAFTAVEDRRLHLVVSPRCGSGWHRRGGRCTTSSPAKRSRRGASTIPMQLARALCGDRMPMDHSWTRQAGRSGARHVSHRTFRQASAGRVIPEQRLSRAQPQRYRCGRAIVLWQIGDAAHRGRRRRARTSRCEPARP